MTLACQLTRYVALIRITARRDTFAGQTVSFVANPAMWFVVSDACHQVQPAVMGMETTAMLGTNASPTGVAPVARHVLGLRHSRLAPPL